MPEELRTSRRLREMSYEGKVNDIIKKMDGPTINLSLSAPEQRHGLEG